MSLNAVNMYFEYTLRLDP